MRTRFEEDELLPISGLAQLAFCPRRCALIHIEAQWEENLFTAEGRVLHERADRPEVENRGDVRIVRALRLRSLSLGLAGQADVVEFHRVAHDTEGATLEGAQGRWIPFPVEYKRCKPKADDCDVVQLCAQAMCLEEMLGVAVPAGALFYGTTRRRTDVVFDAPRRERVESLCRRLHELIADGKTPPTVYEKKCDSCSLIEICKPKALGRRSARRYLDEALAEVSQEGAE